MAVAALIAAALLAATAPGPAHALTTQQVFGIGDQDDGPQMFDDPLLEALEPRATRFIANLSDIHRRNSIRDRLDAWYKAASAKGLRMMIALQEFGRKTPPSDAQYLKAFRAFRKRYPKVREYAVFNEANHITQPTYRRPRRAARYVILARRACPSCKLVGLTLVLGYENEIRYAREFLAALPASERRRLVWGLSAYADANRRSDKRLKRFLRAFPRGEVWFTEAAAWVQFVPPSWPYDLRRQARATRYAFNQALRYRKRVKRLYWYEWRGSGMPAERWDSGLLHPDGRPRPAYDVALQERFRRRL